MSVSRRPLTLLGLPSYLAGHVSTLAKRPLIARLLEHGLRLPHFAVLVGLRDFGPTAQHDLAEHLGFNRSHLVGYLDHLEEGGNLVRTRDTEDRRRQYAELTASGTKLAEDLIEVANTTERTQLAALSDDEIDTLTSLLARVVRADTRLQR
ncbi:MarR family winged helix-turn-helix transcriptional regulator [Microbacterium saperdae]